MTARRPARDDVCARELLNGHSVSLHEVTTITDAETLFNDLGIGAAAVVDAQNRLVSGVAAIFARIGFRST
jgi:CBS domain-containing protein